MLVADSHPRRPGGAGLARGQEPAAGGRRAGRRAPLPHAGDGARVRVGATGRERRGGGGPRGPCRLLPGARRADGAAGPRVRARGRGSRRWSASTATCGPRWPGSRQAGEAEACCGWRRRSATSGASAATGPRATPGWSAPWPPTRVPRSRDWKRWRIWARTPATRATLPGPRPRCRRVGPGTPVGCSGESQRMLQTLGAQRVDQGRYEEGAALLAEAVDVAQLADDPYGEALSLAHLGIVAWGRGDLAEAIALLEAAQALGHGAGLPFPTAVAAHYLGLVASRSATSPARRRGTGSGSPTTPRLSTFSRAQLSTWPPWRRHRGRRNGQLGSSGRPRSLTEAIGLASAWPERGLHERAIAGARAALGDDAFDVAFDAGRRLPREHVLAEVEGVLDAAAGPSGHTRRLSMPVRAARTYQRTIGSETVQAVENADPSSRWGPMRVEIPGWAEASRLRRQDRHRWESREDDFGGSVGTERRLSPHRLRCRFRCWLTSFHNERSRQTCYAMAASCFTRVQIERTVSWETPRSRATLRNPESSARAATSSHRSRGMRGPLVAMAYRPIPDRRLTRRSRSGYRNGMSGNSTTSISRKRSPLLPPVDTLT